MIDHEFWDYVNSIQEYQENEIYYPDIFIRYLDSFYYDQRARPNNPVYATWDLTNTCNLNCYFCSADAKKGIDKNELDKQSKLKVARRLIDWGILYVSIRGGEPSLCKELIDIVELFVENGVYVEVVSNGTGINKNFCDRLKKLPPSMYRIKISLDSYIPEVNDCQRGKHSFYFAIKALENLSEHKIKNIRVQTVITEHNKGQIFKIYKYLHKYNVHSYGFSLLLPSGRSSNFITPAIEKNILRQILEIKQYEEENKRIKLEKVHFGYLQNIEGNEKFYEAELDDVSSNKLFKIKCNAASTRVNINSNGDVYPCDFLKYSPFLAGNILTNDLMDIWESKNFETIRKVTRFDKKECNSCKNKKCSTGCMGLSYLRYHSLLRKDPNCNKEVVS